MNFEPVHWIKAATAAVGHSHLWWEQIRVTFLFRSCSHWMRVCVWACWHRSCTRGQNRSGWVSSGGMMWGVNHSRLTPAEISGIIWHFTMSGAVLVGVVATEFVVASSLVRFSVWRAAVNVVRFCNRKLLCSVVSISDLLVMDPLAASVPCCCHLLWNMWTHFDIKGCESCVVGPSDSHTWLQTSQLFTL